MQEDSVDDSNRRISNLMSLANIAITVILTASVVFEMFSIYLAIGTSLLIWLVFGGFYQDIKQQYIEKRKLVDKGIALHQFCNDCGLRFSSMKNQCPRCDKNVIENKGIEKKDKKYKLPFTHFSEDL